MSTAVADFARAQYASFGATPAGPELSEAEAESEADWGEKILNMDEKTFKKLFNMPKVTEDVLESEAQEINELD
jgi:hypothetical protein